MSRVAPIARGRVFQRLAQNCGSHLLFPSVLLYLLYFPFADKGAAFLTILFFTAFLIGASHSTLSDTEPIAELGLWRAFYRGLAMLSTTVIVGVFVAIGMFVFGIAGAALLQVSGGTQEMAYPMFVGIAGLLTAKPTGKTASSTIRWRTRKSGCRVIGRRVPTVSFSSGMRLRFFAGRGRPGRNSVKRRSCSAGCLLRRCRGPNARRGVCQGYPRRRDRLIQAWEPTVPEIARFFGIVIRMYVEVGESHHRPHFHAYYQDAVAVYAIDNVEPLAGSLPGRQERLVLAWAELHRAELERNWRQLQTGRPPFKIEPLR